jgi:hypothetical protein
MDNKQIAVYVQVSYLEVSRTALCGGFRQGSNHVRKGFLLLTLQYTFALQGSSTSEQRVNDAHCLIFGVWRSLVFWANISPFGQC